MLWKRIKVIIFGIGLSIWIGLGYTGSILLFADRLSCPLAGLVFFLGLTIPWFAIAWGYLGFPLPATLAHKQHQGAVSISQRFSPGLLTIFRSFTTWLYLLEAGVVMAGILIMFRRVHLWAFFLAWAMLDFIAILTLDVSLYFR